MQHVSKQGNRNCLLQPTDGQGNPQTPAWQAGDKVAEVHEAHPDWPPVQCLV